MDLQSIAFDHSATDAQYAEYTIFLKNERVVWYTVATMSQDNLIRMKCEETKDIHYVTRKNKKQNPDPLVRKKYNKKLRKHTVYKETK